MFTGSPTRTTRQIALNTLWLEQILLYGAEAPEQMSQEEKMLMNALLPDVIAQPSPQMIHEHSYFSNAVGHTTVSEAFLKRKIEAYHRKR